MIQSKTRILNWLILCLLATLGCTGDTDSNEHAKADFDESDFSTMVGTWNIPKNDQKFTLFNQGDFYDDGFREIDEITQVQKNYFRVRPKNSRSYILFYVHDNKVLMVVGTGFDRNLNKNFPDGRKLTKALVYQQHHELVTAAKEIGRGNLDVESNAKGLPLFEQFAIRISTKPALDYAQAKRDREAYHKNKKKEPTSDPEKK